MSFDHYKRHILLSLLLASSLLGCNNEDTTSLSTKSIIYCSEGSPEGFNPQIITSGVTVDATSKQLYNRLITFSGIKNDIVPSLAKSWHVTKDGKKITFYLRKDVQFHQTKYFTPTRNLNADDVLFSFNRVLDTNHEYHHISGGNYPFFQSVELDSIIEGIEKINDYTIRFQLTRADSSILANLATDFAVILSEEYAQQLSNLGLHKQIDLLPIGTGPYQLKEYRAGSYIRYTSHANYWGSKPDIEQLIFDITPSNTGRLTKLLAGECDVVAYPIAHNKIIERPDLTLDAVTSYNVGYLGFNTTKPPFDNKLVRKAISLAINKQAILDTIYFGKADIANTIIPPSSWAYDKTLPKHEYSVSHATKLLQQAGYPNGFTMNIWAMPVQRSYNPDALTMAKLIQGDLQKIGVNVTITSNYEWSMFLKLVAEGEHQAVLLGWSADHPDPDNFFSPILSCASALKGNSRTFWCNHKFDEHIQSALRTDNINKRKKHYAQALKIIAEEVPLVPIAHSKRYQGRNNKISGKLLNAFGGINFTEVSKQ